MAQSSPAAVIKVVQGSKWVFKPDAMSPTNNKNLLIEMLAPLMKHFLLLVYLKRIFFLCKLIAISLI